MDRKPVQSSNVTSVGYDPKTQTMEVEFKDGSVYHYHDVEADTHSGLMSAKSAGKYIHANVKNKYKFGKR